MMTIKNFAALCRCNAQTLRYYDKIGLLKPVRVDAWTGYRYYEKAQAIDFVKIKNLQLADFSIEEIKALLRKDDQQIYAAFEQKIAAQEQKLEQIRQIQRSYLKEKMDMEKLVGELADFMLGQIDDYEGLRDFGLDPGEGEEIVRLTREYFMRMMLKAQPDMQRVSFRVNDELVYGAEAAAEKISQLSRENLGDTILLGDETDDLDLNHYETVWETSGWERVDEFIGQIPALDKEKEYCLNFRMKSVKLPDDLSFPIFMIGAMIVRRGAGDVQMGCAIDASDDGQNHFALLRRQ